MQLRVSVHVMAMRLALWLVLMGSLLAAELSSTGLPPADEAFAYYVSALFSLLMFLSLADWKLAALLTFMACFLGWQSVASERLTAGAAILALGISPVLAYATAIFLDVPTCCGCPPDWSSDEPSPRRRCRC
jgi:hypothetical protein